MAGRDPSLRRLLAGHKPLPGLEHRLWHIGHLGVEPFPDRWRELPVRKYITTSTSHAQHHCDPAHNFGFYALLWNQWLGTLPPTHTTPLALVGYNPSSVSGPELIMVLGDELERKTANKTGELVGLLRSIYLCLIEKEAVNEIGLPPTL